MTRSPRHRQAPGHPVPIPETVTLNVPFRIVQRGSRKLVVTPDGIPDHPRPRVDNAIIKALARAFRWRRMLESGHFTTTKDLAEAEKVAHSYLTRILRLTLLAPDIVEAILDGQQGPEVTLARLVEPLPVDWEGQERHLCRWP